VSSNGKKYQLIAKAPTSVEVVESPSFALTTGNDLPRASIKTVHSDQRRRLEDGGTLVAVEFETHTDDLIVAARNGLELAKDVAAAVGLVTGVGLGDPQVLQIATSEGGAGFGALFPTFPMKASERRITLEDLQQIQSFTAHSNALPTGARIGRAARRYAQALARTDSLDAFQLAYAGLEALEKPLGLDFGIEHGVEITKGECKACHVPYEYRRTVSVAVRRFVRQRHGNEIVPEGDKEWKQMSELRHDIVHGLAEIDDMESRAENLIAPAMHHLHDATVHLAHLHELETFEYRLQKPQAAQQVLMMRWREGALPPLEACQPLMDVRFLRWVPHPQYVAVPEMSFNNLGLVNDLEVGARWLMKPLASATEDDLVAAETEQGPAGATETENE
jgi:hypothetical protein